VYNERFDRNYRAEVELIRGQNSTLNCKSKHKSIAASYLMLNTLSVHFLFILDDSYCFLSEMLNKICNVLGNFTRLEFPFQLMLRLLLNAVFAT